MHVGIHHYLTVEEKNSIIAKDPNKFLLKKNGAPITRT